MFGSTSSKDNLSLVVLPTYNERDNLSPLVPAILSTHPDLHVLIIDDGSPDGTGDLADRLAARDDRIHVIHRSSKCGLGTAYVTGFDWALRNHYVRVIQMDADFSHRVEDIARLLDASTSTNVVLGSRSVRGGAVMNWSVTRRLISRLGSAYSRWLLGLSVRDCTTGFRCLSAHALNSIDLSEIRATGYGFQVESLYRWCQAGIAVVEVPIIFPDRTRGKSKMSASIALEAASVVLGLRLASGYHPHIPVPDAAKTLRP